MSADGPTSPEPGSAGAKRFGKYDIQRRLGAGGMGIVYLAVDRELRRTVALKILSKERAENPLLVQRFKSEGQTAAHLQHPGIIHVYESGEIDDQLYLALEYVDGIDLLEWLRKRGVLPVRRSIDIIRQVAEALQHAAEKQIVHRDIKPSNIMIRSDGTAKLADMGLARFVDDSDDTSITRAGTTVGTVDYMAPEQAQNSKAADIRSDIYSLGCAWYHMITGTPPYPEGGVTNKLQAHATGRLPDPRAFNANVPEGVVAVIHRMMSKRPEDRYQTPEELLVDLRNPLIGRGGMSADVFAALAVEAPAAPTDEDFSVRTETKTSDTSLSVGTGATQADWDPDINIDSEDSEGAPETTSATNPRRKPKLQSSPTPSRDRGGSQAAQRETPAVLEGSPTPDLKRSRSGNRAQAGNSGEERSATSKNPRAASTSPTPAQQNTGKQGGKSRKQIAGTSPQQNGPAIAIDYQRISLTIGAIVLLGVSGWVALKQLPRLFTPEEGVAANPYATDLTPAVTPDTANDEPSTEMAPEQEPPPATADSPQPAQEFPGLDDAGLGKDASKEFLPDWLQSGWGQAETPGLSATVIDPYGRAPGSHRTVSAALEQSLGKDILLEFADTGPYQESSIQLGPPVGSPIRQVTVRAPEKQRTTLLVDADNPEQRRWLSMEKGVLHLERLDILIMSRGLNAEPSPFQLLDLLRSDLIIKDCSISVMIPNDAAGQIAGNLIHVSGTSAGKNRVLLENCSLHLQELCGLSIDANSCDIVLGNCLIDSAITPALKLAEPQAEVNSVATNLRRIGMLGCSFVGDGPFLQAHQSDQTPLPLELRVRRSFIVGRTQAGPWIDLNNWPLSTDAKLELPAARDVTLKCEHVRFVNRPILTELTMPSGETTLVVDSTSWRQFWKQPLPSDDLITRPDVTFSVHQKIEANELANIFVEELKPGIGARTKLGIESELIPEAPEDVEQRVIIGLTRARPPAELGQPIPNSKELRFDLKRANSFPDFINSPDCPSGTTITCFGIGLKSLPPIVIRNKKLRIVFEQDQDGVPLVVQPTSDTNSDVWFRVEQGQLDLINAPLRIPTSRSRKYPQVLLKLENSDATLQHCQLQGPDDRDSQSALIQGDCDKNALRFLAIADSLLTSQGTLLAPGNMEVECSNTAIVSLSSAVQLNEPSSHGDQLYFHCSFSCRVAFDATSVGASAEQQRNLFLRNCVFLPPPPDAESSGNTVILSSTGDAIPASLKWWDANCGYSPQILHWLATNPNTPTSTLATDRRRLLTPAQRYQEVTGSNGVLLVGPLPKRADLKADNFQLMGKCDAFNRSLDGGPLGVRLPIGPDLTPTSKPDEATAKPKAPATAPKGPFRPDF